MAMEGTELCLLPSLGWSASKDTDAPQEPAAYEIMTKALDDRQRAKEISNHRDSLSDFEFAAMSAVQNESFNGEHMLAAADELFFKGKLLPLYNPDYEDRFVRQATARGTQDRIDRHVFLNQPPLNFSLYGGADSESLQQADMADLTVPMSPKAPKCSVMLKEIFGWKKMAKSICACAASEEVAAGSSCRSGKKKKKAAKMKQKTPLMLQAAAPSSSLCLASRHLPRKTIDEDSIAMSPARNSVSEPLLTCSVAQLGYAPVSSEENLRYQSFHESLCTHKPLHDQIKMGINGSCQQEEQPHWGSRPIVLSPIHAKWGKPAGKPASGRRSCDGTRRSEEDVCGGRSAERIESGASMEMLLGKTNPYRMWRSASSHEGSRCSNPQGEAAAMDQSRKPRHNPAGLAGESTLAGIPCQYIEDNACTALVTEQVSKLGSTGPWRIRRARKGETSPDQKSSSYGAPATASASQGRSAMVEIENETQRSSEISQSRSSESSSSSSSASARSQQMRKYEQWKVVRQRDSGWRILERSSSYNSGMHSMRVAPVLNVPVIVCMSRSKSSNHVMHTLRRA